MHVIDLSHPLDGMTAPYPGDSPLGLVQNRWLARDHYNAFTLTGGMHLGTHVDLPLHMQDHPLSARDYPLERFHGPGRVIKCPEHGMISPDEGWMALQEGEIPLLYTGWDRHFGQSEYFSAHPQLTMEAAEFLIDRGVGMVVLDMPSPDRTPFTVHKALLAAGILIVENAAHFNMLVRLKHFTFMALPLPLPTEASLVRAVALREG